MNVALFGSTGGIGRATARALLAAGHRVTALARRPETLGANPGLIVIGGDALNKADVARTLSGTDAAIVTLGNSQNPFWMMMGAKRHTAANVCEVGRRNVVEAMRDPYQPCAP